MHMADMAAMLLTAAMISIMWGMFCAPYSAFYQRADNTCAAIERTGGQVDDSTDNTDEARMLWISLMRILGHVIRIVIHFNLHS